MSSIELLSLWQRVFRAVAVSTLKDDKFDAGTSIALGARLSPSRKDWSSGIVELRPSSGARRFQVDLTFITDQTGKQGEWFTELSSAPTSLLSHLRHPAASILPGLAPILQLLNERLAAYCLGCCRLQVCSLQMVSDESVHRERQRLVLALRERFASSETDFAKGVYQPFSFDRLATRAERKKIAEKPKSGAAQMKREYRTNAALVFFFNLTIHSRDGSTIVVDGTRKKDAPARYLVFADELLEERRESDATFLKTHGPDFANIVKGIYIEQLPAGSALWSAYALWKSKIEATDDGKRMLALYQEWVLRKAGYVFAADKLPTKEIEKAMCDYGYVSDILGGVADRLDQTKRRLVQFVVGRPMGIAAEEGLPLASLYDCYAALELASVRTMRERVRPVDTAYARTVCAGMEFNAVRPLAEWFLYGELPKLWGEFIKNYYAWIEDRISSKRKIDVARTLLTLENYYYRRVLAVVFNEIGRRIDAFLGDRDVGEGPLGSVIQEDSESPIFVWYKGNSTLKDLNQGGAYGLGSSAPLLKDLMEHGVGRPIDALNNTNTNTNTVTLASLRADYLPLLKDALTGLEAHIAKGKESLDMVERPRGRTEKPEEEKRLRRAVLLVRNYFLSMLVDPKARAYLIDVLDNLYAEHLGTQYALTGVEAAMYDDDEGLDVVTGAYAYGAENLWLAPLTEEERNYAVPYRIETASPSAAVRRCEKQRWFRRPNANEYLSLTDRAPRTLRQVLRGHDWQTLPLPAEAFRQHVEVQFAQALREIGASVAGEEALLKELVNRAAESPNVDMQDLLNGIAEGATSELDFARAPEPVPMPMDE